MATPRIVSVTAPDVFACGERTDIDVEVEVYDEDTNLTVCFEIQESSSCRFMSLARDSEIKLKECRRRTALRIDTHEFTFRVKLTCPEGQKIATGVDVTARNDEDEVSQTEEETWTVDCR